MVVGSVALLTKPGQMCKRIGLELRNTKQGHTILFLPTIVYTWLCYMLFSINFIIHLACYCQRNGLPEWGSPTPPAFKNKISAERIKELKDRLLCKAEMTFAEEELVQVFDSLEPAQRSDMIGKSYRGHIVRSGCFLDLVDKVIVAPLKKLGFQWGKRYRTQHIGDPLLMCFRDKYFFPLPLWGNVGLSSIEFRNKHQVTMNYDHQPWQDYFRVLDDGKRTGDAVYLGLWTDREKTGGWFTLTVRRDVETL